MNLFDSHAHYNDEKFDLDIEIVIKETLENGVSNFIVAGYDIESSKKAIEIVKKCEAAYAIIGISPDGVKNIKNSNDIEKDIYEIRKIIENNKKIVAVGEIGLDYYWNKENKELQKEMFIKQIELANSLDLPIVIHTREAIMDTIEIIKMQ